MQNSHTCIFPESLYKRSVFRNNASATVLTIYIASKFRVLTNFDMFFPFLLYLYSNFTLATFVLKAVWFTQLV
jgi:hypothetical protein